MKNTLNLNSSNEIKTNGVIFDILRFYLHAKILNNNLYSAVVGCVRYTWMRMSTCACV